MISDSRSNLKPTLHVIGMPLDEEGEILPPAERVITTADLIIGETRKATYGYLKQVPGGKQKEVCLLDSAKAEDRTRLVQRLKEIAKTAGSVALFSDMGMPLLFDPGREVLDTCRQLGFQIRSVPGPTSWGTACALSGYLPPFLILGFLPRDADERSKGLRQCAETRTHSVILETPYRFLRLLEECRKLLGERREIFLAWEIGKSEEWLFWGSGSSLLKESAARGLRKGEFVLIIKGRE